MAGWRYRDKDGSNEVLFVNFVVFNFSLYRINKYGLVRLGQNNSEVILLLQITAISYNVTSILSPTSITLWAKNITCNVREQMTKCKEWHIKVNAIITNINSTLIIYIGLYTMIKTCHSVVIYISKYLNKRVKWQWKVC